MAGMFIEGLGRVKGITPRTIIHIDGNNAHVRKVSRERLSSFVKEILDGKHKEMNGRLSERLPRLNPSLRCVQPNAPMAECCVCSKKIKTCERKESVGKSNDYTCPIHREGCQLQNGEWVCSFEHWEIAIKKYYGQVI